MAFTYHLAEVEPAASAVLKSTLVLESAAALKVVFKAPKLRGNSKAICAELYAKLYLEKGGELQRGGGQEYKVEKKQK